jgi:signal transduction histidine kinase
MHQRQPDIAERRSRPLHWFIQWAWFGPAALAGLFLLLVGGIVWIVQSTSLESQRVDLVGNAATAQESVRRRLNADQHYLDLLGDREEALRAPDPTIPEYLSNHPELVTIRFVDTDNVVRWIAPGQVSDHGVGVMDVSPEAARAIDLAQSAREPMYTNAFISISRGEPVFEAVAPVFRDQRYMGAMVGTYSCERVVRHALPRETFQKHRVSIVDGEGNDLIRLPGDEHVDERLVRQVELKPPGHGIALKLERYGAGVWGWGLTLLTVLCVSLVLGMAWGMWSLNRHIARRAAAERALRQARDMLEQRVSERTVDLEQANAKLQLEMAQRAWAEQRVRDHQEQLAYVARQSTMGEMAAGLAHELNQPLGAIASYAQGCRRLLDAEKPDAGELRHAMREVAGQALRAGRIINRLRESISQRTPPRAISGVDPLVREVADLLDAESRQQQVELVFDMPPTLPAVLVDRIQVQQVLLNVMRNAIEAMISNNGRARRLTVRATPEGDQFVRIAVSDTGPGCTHDQVQQIFDAFYTTKQQGMGMGLSISRSIIEAHEGRLWAQPNEGRGLTVCFTLPTADGTES